MSSPNSYRGSSLAPRETLVEHLADGSLILRSPIPFEVPQWSILDFLPAWAEKAPERIFLAQRGRDGACKCFATSRRCNSLSRARGDGGYWAF